MTMKARAIATVFALVAVLVMLSSSIFLIEHAEHDCAGADCPICEQLYACAQSLRNLAAAGAVVLTVAGFATVSCAALCPDVFVGAPQTPVQLKVKLSN